MADRTSTSPSKKVVIEGKTYEVRTVTQWKDGGRPGTIDDSTPPIVIAQYKPEPSLLDPFPQFQTIADRTGNSATNNGWSFRPSASPGFKKELVKKGPTSLSSQLDTATQNQVAKDAVVPIARAQQSLKKTSTTKTNQALAAANQDPTAPAGGQNVAQADQAGDGATTPDITDLKAAIKTNSNTRVKFPGAGGSAPLVYPEDIRNTKQDVIKFEMLQYEARGFSTTKNRLAQIGTRDSKRNSIGTVILPIPSGISDASAVTWQQDSLDPAQAALANIALKTITSGFGAGGKEIGNILQESQTPNSNQETKTAVAAAFASAATGIGAQILTRTTGAVVNPNMELLFNGPTLRPFSFNFKMSARNDREARTIIKIIRFFQQGMAAQKSESNLFLKSPHTFRIRYLHRPKGADADHPYIGAIKECALQNFTVNYTPEGQYATFYDGVMVSYEMSMSFTELEPVYNEDYGNDADFPEDLLFKNPSTKP